MASRSTPSPVHGDTGEPAGSAEVLRCVWCYEDIDPERQAYTVVQCSVPNCGISTYHKWCSEEYVRFAAQHKLVSSTKGRDRLQRIAAKADQQSNLRSLKEFPCPMGRNQKKHQAMQWCKGHVLDFELVDKPAATKKKKKKALPQPQQAAKQQQQQQSEQTGDQQQLQQSQGQAEAEAPAADGDASSDKKKLKKEKKMLMEARTMNLEKAKEFLGVTDDQINDSSKSQPVVEQAAPATSSAVPGAPLAPVDQQYKEVTEFRLDTPEDAEVAVAQGLLPDRFRTRFCRKALQGEECERPESCMFAHSSEQLRADAAIALGILPQDYKFYWCSDWHKLGSCDQGLECHFAHTLSEVRVLPAIRAGAIDPDYKTRLCANYEHTGGECPLGIVCNDAHGPDEIRREAAVALGCLPRNYKVTLCEEWMSSGETYCTAGEDCPHAHGYMDLRLQAAVVVNLVPPNYKSAMCCMQDTGLPCSRPSYMCHYAHDEDELRMPYSAHYKTVYCQAFQEIGSCPWAAVGLTCIFAHGPAELHIPNIGTKVQRVKKLVPLSAPPPVPPPPPHGGAGSSAAAAGGGKGTDRARGHAGGQRAEGSRNEDSAKPEVAIPRNEPRFTLCTWHGKGIGCPKGRRCPFAHGDAELKRREAKYRREQLGEPEPAREHRRGSKAVDTAQHEWGAGEGAVPHAPGDPHGLGKRPATSSCAGTGTGMWDVGGDADVVSDVAVEAMRAFKQRQQEHSISKNIMTLVDMGFDVDNARRAVMATGGDVSAAVQFLSDGAGSSSWADPGGMGDVGWAFEDVSAEVAALLEFCHNNGLSAAEASAEVVVQGGDWDAATAELMQRQEARGAGLVAMGVQVNNDAAVALMLQAQEEAQAPNSFMPPAAMDSHGVLPGTYAEMAVRAAPYTCASPRRTFDLPDTLSDDGTDVIVSRGHEIAKELGGIVAEEEYEAALSDDDLNAVVAQGQGPSPQGIVSNTGAQGVVEGDKIAMLAGTQARAQGTMGGNGEVEVSYEEGGGHELDNGARQVTLHVARGEGDAGKRQQVDGGISCREAMPGVGSPIGEAHGAEVRGMVNGEHGVVGEDEGSDDVTKTNLPRCAEGRISTNLDSKFSLRVPPRPMVMLTTAGEGVVAPSPPTLEPTMASMGVNQHPGQHQQVLGSAAIGSTDISQPLPRGRVSHNALLAILCKDNGMHNGVCKDDCVRALQTQHGAHNDNIDNPIQPKVFASSGSATPVSFNACIGTGGNASPSSFAAKAPLMFDGCVATPSQDPPLAAVCPSLELPNLSHNTGINPMPAPPHAPTEDATEKAASLAVHDIKLNPHALSEAHQEENHHQPCAPMGKYVELASAHAPPAALCSNTDVGGSAESEFDDLLDTLFEG